jgi:hypothetical protein
MTMCNKLVKHLQKAREWVRLPASSGGGAYGPSKQSDDVKMLTQLRDLAPGKSLKQFEEWVSQGVVQGVL